METCKLLLGFCSLLTAGAASPIIQRDGCEPGWDLPASSLANTKPFCYKFAASDTDISWYDAYRLCQNENAEFFYPDSTEEAYWVWRVLYDPLVDKSHPHQNDQSISEWLMNARKINSSTSIWSNGQNLERYRNILYYAIDDGYSSSSCGFTWYPTCYYIIKSSQELYTCECTRKLDFGYVCKKEMTPNLTDSSQITAVEIVKNGTKCPTGWIEPNVRVTFVEYCYKLKTLSSASWEDANRECEENGAELISFDHYDEVTWLYPKLTDWFAVNLHRSKYFDGWAWGNKKSATEVGNLYWLSGEPNTTCDSDWGDTMSCGIMRNRELTNIFCDAKTGIITGAACKMRKFKGTTQATYSPQCSHCTCANNVYAIQKNGKQICHSTCRVGCKEEP